MLAGGVATARDLFRRDLIKISYELFLLRINLINMAQRREGAGAEAEPEAMEEGGGPGATPPWVFPATRRRFPPSPPDDPAELARIAEILR